MKYYITIQKRIFFGLLPWTTVRTARNAQHAAELMAEELGNKVHHSDIKNLLNKKLIINSGKTVTINT
jgi:hypothetical protein